MLQTDYRGLTIESAILEELAHVGTCTINELYQRLPHYSWGQVFSIVDRLSRQDDIVIKHPAPSHYVLSLAPHHADQARDAT
ncbi:MAG: hypothetical protein ACREJN_00375 [Nitrospiraceae bacterium]